MNLPATVAPRLPAVPVAPTERPKNFKEVATHIGRRAQLWLEPFDVALEWDRIVQLASHGQIHYHRPEVRFPNDGLRVGELDELPVHLLSKESAAVLKMMPWLLDRLSEANAAGSTDQLAAVFKGVIGGMKQRMLWDAAYDLVLAERLLNNPLRRRTGRFTPDAVAPFKVPGVRELRQRVLGVIRTLSMAHELELQHQVAERVQSSRSNEQVMQVALQHFSFYVEAYQQMERQRQEQAAEKRGWRRWLGA